jgi:hypothetical protein
MVANLNFKINPANFETVRDQIAAILKIELDNQSIQWQTGSGTTHDPYVPNLDLTGSVWTERFTPVDRVEGNVINVSILNINLDNQTPISQKNTVSYAIDVYTNAVETSAQDGCYISGQKLHRLTGLIRSIIQSPVYDRLGMSNGIVERRSVSGVIFGHKEDNHDTINTRMDRITLKVEIHEETSGIVPTELSTMLTKVKIEQTNKGYQFINNNT